MRYSAKLAKILIQATTAIILTGCLSHVASIPVQTSDSLIQKISLIREIEPALERADANTLVVFDVDDVILSPKDLAERIKAEDASKAIVKEYLEKYSREQGMRVDAIHMLSAKVELVEQRIKEIIDGLNEKGIRTIALTAMKIRTLSLVGDTLEWRVNQLKSLGLQFPWPHTSSRLDWTAERAGHLGGVFFSGDIPKGKALIKFLEHFKWRPNKVIFVDDREKNIESVQAACLEAGIPYNGFLYKAAIFDQDPVFDPKIYRLRLETLFEHGRYLSDDDALKLMGK